MVIEWSVSGSGMIINWSVVALSTSMRDQLGSMSIAWVISKSVSAQRWSVSGLELQHTLIAVYTLHCRIFSHFKIKIASPPSFPLILEHTESGNIRKTNLSAYPTPSLIYQHCKCVVYMEINIEVCVQDSSLKLKSLKILV